MIETFTISGARLRLHKASPGSRNWLLLPGGPGLGSESLEELADAIDVAGRVWLVDLPGDGSNIPREDPDPYRHWPGALAEAAAMMAPCVFLGHSMGGMYLLSVPEVEPHLDGLVLLSTSPDSSWRPAFDAMCRDNPIPAVARAAAAYEAHPSDERLRDICVASAPWNFEPRSLAAGQALLQRLPINGAATAWSAAHFDDIYEAKWFPAALPTLILAGRNDRIVSQAAWDAGRFRRDNVLRETIEAAGHFPWIDDPEAVTEALRRFEARLGAA